MNRGIIHKLILKARKYLKKMRGPEEAEIDSLSGY
jgi:hypothetical protein